MKQKQFYRFLLKDIKGQGVLFASLHPSTDLNVYERCEVVRPIPVQSGTVAPFYGQPGTGIQYQTNLPIETLRIQGYLRLIP